MWGSASPWSRALRPATAGASKSRASPGTGRRCGSRSPLDKGRGPAKRDPREEFGAGAPFQDDDFVIWASLPLQPPVPSIRASLTASLGIRHLAILHAKRLDTTRRDRTRVSRAARRAYGLYELSGAPARR